jgi:hypothetical protein
MITSLQGQISKAVSDIEDCENEGIIVKATQTSYEGH